jgi:hypothetical protein
MGLEQRPVFNNASLPPGVNLAPGVNFDPLGGMFTSNKYS